MSAEEYRMEIMLDSPDQVLAVLPPVDVVFRQLMYERLEETGILKEMAIREGSFFGTQYLPDGTPYSALRISQTALKVATMPKNPEDRDAADDGPQDPDKPAGARSMQLLDIAEMGKSVLKELHGEDTGVDIDHHWVVPGGSRKLFERPTPDS